MEWQPIDTAPKDGRNVLVFDGEPEPYIAWWHLTNAEWRASDGAVSPTHWHPLPPPPEEG